MGTTAAAPSDPEIQIEDVYRAFTNRILKS
jgi:hypothetical protein